MLLFTDQDILYHNNHNIVTPTTINYIVTPVIINYISTPATINYISSSAVANSGNFGRVFLPK